MASLESYNGHACHFKLPLIQTRKMPTKRQHQTIKSQAPNNTKTSTNNKTYHLFLLDLPKYISISINGHTPKILKETDNTFIGISNIPCAEETFHFVCIKNVDGHSVNTSSLILLPSEKRYKHYPHVARRYDPAIEDLVVVDDLTLTNLLYSLEENSIGSSHTSRMMVPFTQFISTFPSVEAPATTSNQWEELTKYISKALLDKKGIFHGDKVIPSTYHDESEKEASVSTPMKLSDNDDVEVQYPPIPCILNEQNKIQFTRNKHKGTSKFLSNLTPAQRTSLFYNSHQNIIQMILSNHYNSQWNEFIGDFQLSFILMIYIGCLHSLEYWRDVICMLSFLNDVEGFEFLFCVFLSSLKLQFHFMDADFFQVSIKESFLFLCLIYLYTISGN